MISLEDLTKAQKCIKIALAILPTAPEDVIERQAYDLLDLTEAAIDQTLERIRIHRFWKVIEPGKYSRVSLSCSEVAAQPGKKHAKKSS